MRCRMCEQDLLLLVHKELSPARGLLLWAHLRGCAACQQRHAGLTWASHAVAGAVRAETMPRWQPGRALAAGRAPSSVRWWLLSALIFLAGAVTLLYPHVRASSAPAASAPASIAAPIGPAHVCPFSHLQPRKTHFAGS